MKGVSRFIYCEEITKRNIIKYGANKSQEFHSFLWNVFWSIREDLRACFQYAGLVDVATSVPTDHLVDALLVVDDDFAPPVNIAYLVDLGIDIEVFFGRETVGTSDELGAFILGQLR